MHLFKSVYIHYTRASQRVKMCPSVLFVLCTLLRVPSRTNICWESHWISWSCLISSPVSTTRMTNNMHKCVLSVHSANDNSNACAWVCEKLETDWLWPWNLAEREHLNQKKCGSENWTCLECNQFHFAAKHVRQLSSHFFRSSDYTRTHMCDLE